MKKSYMQSSPKKNILHWQKKKTMEAREMLQHFQNKKLKL